VIRCVSRPTASYSDRLGKVSDEPEWWLADAVRLAASLIVKYYYYALDASGVVMNDDKKLREQKEQERLQEMLASPVLSLEEALQGSYVRPFAKPATDRTLKQKMQEMIEAAANTSRHRRG